MLTQTTETTGSTIATQGEGQLIATIFLWLLEHEIIVEDLGPYSSHGSFELMISANFLWLSCRRVYLDLIFLNLPISCNIAMQFVLLGGNQGSVLKGLGSQIKNTTSRKFSCTGWWFEVLFAETC